MFKWMDGGGIVNFEVMYLKDLEGGYGSITHQN